MDDDHNLHWRELWFDVDRRPYGPRLAGDTCYHGSTYYAAGTDVSSCGANDAGDGWHRVSVAEKGLWSFDLTADGFDATMALMDRDGREVACVDDGGRLDVVLEGGSDYLVRVAGANGGAGRYRLCAWDVRCRRPVGDVDGDGVVKLVDFGLVTASWLECGFVDGRFCPGGG